jgi:hypothetical protein
MYNTKLLAHKEFIQEVDLKFNELIQDHDLEIEKLKCQVQEHQYEIGPFYSEWFGTGSNGGAKLRYGNYECRMTHGGVDGINKHKI